MRMMKESNSGPDQCVECGACEAACPQHLSIRENLAALQAELDEACANA